MRYYLDYNATSPLCDAAKDALIEAINVYGNPSSVHKEGRIAKAAVQKTRGEIAALFNEPAENVIFTSGATEALNTLLTPYYFMGTSPIHLSHLYVGATEHPCVLQGGCFKAENKKIIPVNSDGIIDTEILAAMLAAHNKEKGLPLVAIQAANNETGVIQPLEDIAKITHEAGGLLIVDCVQYLREFSSQLKTIPGDFFVISGHKIGAPKGIAAFILRGGLIAPAPLMSGGGQERGLRAGTHATTAIIAFGAAIKALAMKNAQSQQGLRKLQKYLEQGLKELDKDIKIYGEHVQRLANTTFFSIPGKKAETLQIALDLEGFAVSAGAACSSGKVKKSSVLSAMGFPDEFGALRVSIGEKTDPETVEKFLQALKKILSNI